MGNFWDTAKKFGASLIVLMLILMLALTFSSQPMDEILDLISGASKVGSYRGEPILVKDYQFVYAECENHFQRYGLVNVPPILMQNCITENIMALYVKPGIARDLGFDVSKDFIERQVEEYVKQIYNAQLKTKLREDVIPAEELYRRELQYLPVSKRMALYRTGMMENFFEQPFPKPVEVQEMEGYEVILDLEYIAFTNSDLLTLIKVEVNDEEIRLRYEKEKEEFFAKEENKNQKYPSYEERYIFLKEKITEEKKKEVLQRIKQELGSENKAPDFDAIEKITGIKRERTTLSLQDLYAWKIKNKTLRLAKPELFLSILNDTGEVIGPLTEQDYTLYLKINRKTVRKRNNPPESIQGSGIPPSIGYYFYDYILEQYRKRGNFTLVDLPHTQKEKEN